MAALSTNILILLDKNFKSSFELTLDNCSHISTKQAFFSFSEKSQEFILL
jgi:hypothetical protein